MPGDNEKEQQVEQEPGEKDHLEPNLEDVFKDLPISDDQKKLLAGVIGGVAANLTQINTRLETLEKQPANENPDLYAGLSPDQRYQVLMARASAPAAAAQQGLLQALLSRVGGGGGGGDLAALAKSAASIQALRTILTPEVTPLQEAMEKAQVASILAQTRLVNKVAGKATSDYVDKIEAGPKETGEGEAQAET
ncbi:hypothetical protein ES702_04786 [subsurface metagenome]